MMSTADVEREAHGDEWVAATSHPDNGNKVTSPSPVSMPLDPHRPDLQPGRRSTTAGAAHLSLGDVEAVEVQTRDLSVTVDTSPSIWEPSTYPELLRSRFSKSSEGPRTTKTLLHSVSASLQPGGSLTAILGGSGSGKATLLNTVAERMHSNRLTRTGKTTFNGLEGVHFVRHAYVMQQDILLPTLTVRETLQYAASLRLPPTVTEEERERVVEEVILELGPRDCANTRIGNSQHRGCSGGEKRRTSIGVQLLANPSILFLDEPTTARRRVHRESREAKSGLERGIREDIYVSPTDDTALDTVAKGRPPRQAQHVGFLRQLTVLTDRTLKVTYRDPMGMAGSIAEAILMAVITGYIFYDLPRDQPGIRSRQAAALYISVGLQGYLFLLFEIYRLTMDISTFDRENSESCVTALPYVLSRRLARLFTEDVPVPFLYSVIYYFMVGFDSGPAKFFTFFSIVLLNHYIAVTLAMTSVAAVRHFPRASLIANLVYTLQSMACGYFYYAFGALCGNEFEGSFYDCPLPGGEPNPACRQYTGEYIMDNLGFPRNWVARPIIVMFAFVVLSFALSWVGLAFLKVKMTIARARNSEGDLSAGKEKMTARSIQEVRAIDVGLDKFALGLDKRSALGKKLPTKTILNPVSATFQAGKLNIIMGPSGSGKTSLLNSMALRLKNSFGTRYRPSGSLKFNDAIPSESVIRSVVSYVCQDDDALLPSLTVRETLRFAAALRLPSWMSKQEKYQRAEEVLLKMGLKDCADSLVGSDLVKGISGGEKRRVSIAVQILTDPRVLLLDEPTSGLDAFTANSIMEVLQGLANEGRTLILTIHQARSDLFNHFGNVLLLARGGSPVYAGAAKDMLNYF
ncbi:hypothetical protein DL762_004601 [Monosporascus cannonballus]|uniref:ABC transporter domain-containing protein n=1 Tax=Monosporascus cannonballus TaxID=155416 RepID=A0ABY0HBP4_9PEZI|nr:hypothetical protein DL762_004601 [Monosporascus cannonballus]